MVELVSTNYAQVLFELATEDNIVDETALELKEIVGVLLENPKFMVFLTSPVISKKEKIQSLDAIFTDKINLTTKNFLKVLVENGRISYFYDIVDDYEKLKRQSQAILYVNAITAIPMNDEQKQRLTQRLESKLGKKIELHNSIDEGIIGGMKICFGEKTLDATVKSKLQDLQARLGKL